MTVELLDAEADAAEVAKFAVICGYDLELQPSSATQNPVAVLHRRQPVEMERELGNLVILQALSSRRSPEQVLDAIRDRLETSQAAAMDRPLGDVAD